MLLCTIPAPSRSVSTGNISTWKFGQFISHQSIISCHQRRRKYLFSKIKEVRTFTFWEIIKQKKEKLCISNISRDFYLSLKVVFWCLINVFCIENFEILGKLSVLEEICLHSEHIRPSLSTQFFKKI